MKLRVNDAYQTLIDHEPTVVRLRQFLARDQCLVVDLKTGREYERGHKELSRVPDGVTVPTGWGPP